METSLDRSRTAQYALGRRSRTGDRGIALVLSLVMSLAIMALAASVMYFISQSTRLSGVGKRYATATEAADGAVQAAKDIINQIQRGGTIDSVLVPTAGCLTNAVVTAGSGPCERTLTLPALTGVFTATITIERLYSATIPGGRLEFARSAGGAPSEGIFYRISSRVVGPPPTQETAENTALYRFTG